MDKRSLKVDAQKCVQCLCCQLQCSLSYTGAFNPEKARVIVDPPGRISFSEECVSGCSLCARYCFLGAITAP